MSGRKPYPPRPSKPLKISSLQSSLDFVANHTRAGFPPIPDELVRTHYFRFLDFLQSHGYTSKQIVKDISNLTPSTTLWSTDLTSEGWRFVQYAHDRWMGRTYKYSDTPIENAYLDRWHDKFLDLPRVTFSDASDT
jgi:hypothetical protein